MAALIFNGSMHQVSFKISTKTGFAPIYKTGSTEAIQVISGTITSSPAFIPNANKAKWMAPVHEEVAKANLVCW